MTCGGLVMRCVNHARIRRRGVDCPSAPPAVLSRAARSLDQRPPLRLAGRLSPTTGSARWTNRFPGPHEAWGLPDGFPRYRMRLRRIKRSGSSYDHLLILVTIAQQPASSIQNPSNQVTYVLVAPCALHPASSTQHPAPTLQPCQTTPKRYCFNVPNLGKSPVVFFQSLEHFAA